jgi:hypothetical protein
MWGIAEATSAYACHIMIAFSLSSPGLLFSFLSSFFFERLLHAAYEVGFEK